MMQTITIKSEVQLNELLLDKVYGKIKRAIIHQKESSVSFVMGYPVTMKIHDKSIVATVRNKLD